MAPPRTELVQVGDVILAQGLPEKKQLDKFGLRLLDTPRQPSPVTDAGVVLAEVMLAPHAALVGKSLRQIHFRRKYNFNVLAIWRAGQSQQAELADLPLQLGDVLLVQGPAAGLSVLRAERDFIVLEEDPDPVFAPGKARHALIITLGVLGVASLGWLPVAQVSLLGAVLMVLSGCLSLEDAYGAIEWKAIFLIAGMWPLSTAISSSGLADGLVQALLATFGRLPPLALAGILLLVTTLLTQFMGGQVASLVLAPLAISAAAALGADARGLGMAVALGCSLAFLTPFGHPVNIMVMGPGGYSFRDFLRVGAPLTLLEAAVILLGLHFFWGI
jgi:di/tricarboxylate transporter